MRKYEKYKPSGIDWIGDIPEGWEVKKLKYVATLINQKSDSSKYEFQIALENIEGFTGKYIETDSLYECDGIIFRKGDILFNKLRPYLGKVYLTTKSGLSVGDIFVLKSNDFINEKFLFYRLLSEQMISIINGATYGAKMPRASWGFISNLKLPWSKIDEQQRIADFLDKKMVEIDALIDKIKDAIDMLQEYRTALISEAVTGKIDVRGETA